MARSPIWARRPKTRGWVLDVIRAARTISRVELAAATGLTGATISEIVRELLDGGLVVEVGRGAPTGGKPRTLVQLNPLARGLVGLVPLFYGGRKLVYASMGLGLVDDPHQPGA